MVELRDYQTDAVQKLQNGNILQGDVGSGKSRTAIAYYIFLQNGRSYDVLNMNPKDLIIITTAKKRDTNEWEFELSNFSLSTNSELNRFGQNITIDSWNNITKYKDVTDSFFIFDEQRVVGYGTWAKTFISITKSNEWILLTATPGDTWSDYIPVFVANGFYKNKTDFERQHAVYSRYTKYPKIDRYIDQGKLLYLKNKITVRMNDVRETTQHHEDLIVGYDKMVYNRIQRDRVNIETGEPLKNISALCYQLRKVVNSDAERYFKAYEIAKEKNKVIIFYNFDYELESLHLQFDNTEFSVSEWNGHKHEQIPNSDKWVYFVQYAAGCEGWNCITTDTIIFISQSYSYKTMEQAAGRIDRMNTPFKDLWYYHFRSNAKIDLAIYSALCKKKNFNEKKFIK